jgi:hypothetical protein
MKADYVHLMVSAISAQIWKTCSLTYSSKQIAKENLNLNQHQNQLPNLTQRQCVTVMKPIIEKDIIIVITIVIVMWAENALPMVIA